MVQTERFELRAGSRVWATLSVDPNGVMTLEHALTEYEVRRCQGLVTYDSSGQPLSIEQGQYVCLSAPDGSIRLKLKMASAGEISDVVDRKAQVQLVIKLSGSGSVGNDPIKAGKHFFNLRWIAHAN